MSQKMSKMKKKLHKNDQIRQKMTKMKKNYKMRQQITKM